MSVLIIDDETTFRETLAEVLKEEGYTVRGASDGPKGLSLIQKEHVDVVLCDIRMPKMDGIEVLQRIKDFDPSIDVIVITAYGTIETAVEAIRKGAYDYVLKPFYFEDIVQKIKHIARLRELSAQSIVFQEELEQHYGWQNIVGESQAMNEVFALCQKAAPTSSNVILCGESGTGKELVARAIHYSSPRQSKRFMPINCGAIPETLFESQLFGHTKGAFTGAEAAHKGFLEVANSGTVFLDEISSMPPTMQAKLLRTLEDKTITPLGSTLPIDLDIRIISATNANLEDLIAKGKFREDLFYRLNVVQINLPPLRQRKEDIVPLLQHFLKQFNEKMGKKIRGVDTQALNAMLAYDWKGNVRELENVIERAFIVAERDTIGVSDLPAGILPQEPIPLEKQDLKEASKTFERSYIISVLRLNKNNKEHAARELGISLSSLYRKMEEYGIPLS